ALRGVKDYVSKNLDALAAAVEEIQAAAPAPDEDGWNASRDADAVASMKAAWQRARDSYEHIEGAIAVLFPEIDISIDERYDAFVETMADDNLFDGTGVTGVHAIERILWSDSISQRVINFESKLPHYQPAVFPANAQQARDFKEKLCGQLVADTQTM